MGVLKPWMNEVTCGVSVRERKGGQEKRRGGEGKNEEERRGEERTDQGLSPEPLPSGEAGIRQRDGKPD